MLAGHFLVTLIYVTPNHYFPSWVNNVAHSYMSPVFHQAWDLFAPDPPLKEKSLKFRLKSEGYWTDWIEPEKKLLQDHNQWRLSTANISYRLHQNAAFRVWEEAYRADQVAGRKGDDFNREEYLLKSRGYRTAKYYAAQYFKKSHRSVRADSIQLKLVIRTPPPFPNSDGNWTNEIINFPKDDTE